MIRSELKKFIQKSLNVRAVGVFDYLFFFKKYANRYGTAFNGQQLRQSTFLDLNKKIKIDNIIETGTYRGTTTKFFQANTNINIYTCEISSRYHQFSRMRFRNLPKIILKKGNSVDFLKEVSKNPEITNSICFFYLDAHWEEHLPLFEELSVILSNWKSPIVMIDDFKVPNDPGYSYDDYGEGNVLDLNYLSKLPHKINYFFPINSSSEGGRKRGSVVLTNNENLAQKIRDIPSLYEYK